MKYTEDLIALADFRDSRIVDTLTELNVKLWEYEGSPISNVSLYYRLVRCQGNSPLEDSQRTTDWESSPL